MASGTSCGKEGAILGQTLALGFSISVIAIVYFQRPIYNHQYPKDPGTKIASVRHEYVITATSFLK